MNNPFVGNETLSTKTVRQFRAAQLSPGETMRSWLGLVNRQNFKDQSVTLMGHETIKSAENSPILTMLPLIGITFVQSDFDGSAEDSADEQKQSVQLLNLSKWPALMDRVQQTGLESTLGNHFQFGIAVVDIESIELKQRLFNPGVFIHLQYAATLKYAMFGKESLPQFADAARAVGITVR